MGPRTRLAIVGASVRAAAQSALRAGFDVVGADLFADADLDGVFPITKIPGERYPEALADWLANQDVDAWMYTGALENHPELVDRMAEIAPLWGVGGEALRECRDPLHLQRTFKAWGIGFPETRVWTGGSRDQAGWLAKTYRHGGGAGVGNAPSVDNDLAARWYEQKLIVGQPHSAVFAIGRQGATVLGITEQLIGSASNDAPCWAYCGSIGPLRVNAVVSAAIQRLGDCLAQRLGVGGLIGVDLVIDGDRVTVIEVNPRYTASIEVLEAACGFPGAVRASCIETHALAYKGSFALQSISEGDRVLAKRVLFARNAIRIEGRLAGWIRQELRAGRLADAPRIGETIDAGRPLFTLFATGEDTASARAMLIKAIASAERVIDNERRRLLSTPGRSD